MIFFALHPGTGQTEIYRTYQSPYLTLKLSRSNLRAQSPSSVLKINTRQRRRLYAAQDWLIPVGVGAERIP